MIVVSGEIAVDPGSHDDLLGLIDAVEAPSRAEPGCTTYEFWLHRTERGKVHVFEVWVGPEAIAEHLASDHYRAFARGLKQLPVEAVDVHQYVVSGD